MKLFRAWTATTAMLLLVGSNALAGDPINETKSAASDGRVTIENISGSVTVVGWDKDEIEITGMLGDGVKELVFDVDGKRAHIEVKLPRRARNVEESELHVQVPKGSDVKVETVSAWIDAEDVDGELHVASVSGDVRVDGSPAKLRAKSVSGDLTIEATTADAHLETVSGDIEAEGISGEVEAQSVSGDIRIEADRLDGAHASTVSADIDFHVENLGDGRFDFESHSGSIELVLPDGAGAEIDISTFSGDIDNDDFGNGDSRVKRFGPGEEARLTVGDGRASVSISTFSGDVTLVRGE